MGPWTTASGDMVTGSRCEVIQEKSMTIYDQFNSTVEYACLFTILRPTGYVIASYGVETFSYITALTVI